MIYQDDKRKRERMMRTMEDEKEDHGRKKGEIEREKRESFIGSRGG